MIRLRDLSIRAKLSAGFALSLALVVGMGLLSVLPLRAVTSLATVITETWLPELQRLGDLKRAMGEHRLLASRRIDTTDFHQVAGIDEGLERADSAAAIAARYFKDVADADSEKDLIAEFERQWLAYKASMEGAFGYLDGGDPATGRIEFDTTTEAGFSAALATVDRLLVISREEAVEVSDRADSLYRLALILTIGGILVAAASVGGAVRWISRSVTAPILRISDAMRRLTLGDNSVRVSEDAGRKDEIGVLAGAVEGYRASLDRVGDLAVEANTERQRFEAAVTNMPIGLCMFDGDKRLIICNARYREMYGLPVTLTLPGTPWRDIALHRIDVGFYVGSDPDKHIANLMEIIERNQPYVDMLEFRDGRIFSLIHQPMQGGGWVSTHEDVTDRRKTEARIIHMARHDALTDLPNRVLFRERAGQALASTRRGERAALLCLDLDHFKAVNDTLGHPIGDALLASVAERLRDSVREGDTVARFGGDEFAIVQVGVDQPMGATTLAQRIIDSLSRPYTIEGHQVVIGVSVGIAVAPTDGETADQLLKNGDMALYRAKADGRGVFRFFEPEMDVRMQARRAIELDLRQALLRKEFELHYQPIADLNSGAITTVEALIRWHHPTRGLVLPGEFIPVAEEIGLIVQIGDWVLRQACLDAVTWPDNVKVAINLSPVQFRNERLVQSVIAALAASGLSPGRLEVEITETVLLGDNETTLAILHQLRTLGVRVSMDDFGTGYSSLSYLRSFPFDKIKIDRSFIRDLSSSGSSLAIIRAVTGLGTSLGMITTAEGVETRSQLDRVRAEGCTEAQGYLISKPVPVAEIAALIDRRSTRATAA